MWARFADLAFRFENRRNRAVSDGDCLWITRGSAVKKLNRRKIFSGELVVDVHSIAATIIQC
jgi:hypothetical protein